MPQQQQQQQQRPAVGYLVNGERNIWHKMYCQVIELVTCITISLKSRAQLDQDILDFVAVHQDRFIAGYEDPSEMTFARLEETEKISKLIYRACILTQRWRYAKNLKTGNIWNTATLRFLWTCEKILSRNAPVDKPLQDHKLSAEQFRRKVESLTHKILLNCLLFLQMNGPQLTEIYSTSIQYQVEAVQSSISLFSPEVNIYPDTLPSLGILVYFVSQCVPRLSTILDARITFTKDISEKQIILMIIEIALSVFISHVGLHLKRYNEQKQREIVFQTTWAMEGVLRSLIAEMQSNGASGEDLMFAVSCESHLKNIRTRS
eukprot:TRINITY_DN12104_c0_g1_i1.p1 TRINITY_DN12104_c0_g1~~TRINITY_DN12104_c0_g1_i1.p1  ORF type:complete len:352 (+),score=55.82 TRINITY_DN12104_c0_g1_i1:100-1056(+)